MTDRVKKRLYHHEIWIWGGVAAVGMLAAALLIITYRYPAWDFRNNLWGPARLLVQGERPYDLQALEELSLSWSLPFYRSIWFPTIVGTGLSLGWLPLSNAANVWLLLSLLAALVSVALVLRALLPHPGTRGLLATGCVVMLFAPLFGHLNQGQVSLLVLASTVLGWTLLERDRPRWAGVIFSLGWAKPQLVILVWPAMALLGAQRRQALSLLLGWLAGSLLQTVPLWLLEPAWPSGYLEALRANPKWLQPNLHSLTTFWLKSGAVGWIATFLVLGVTAVWLTRLWIRRGGVFALAWTLALTPLLSPFSWSYDQVLLLPLLIISLVPQPPGVRRFIGWSVFVVCQAAYFALRLQNGPDQWYAWYPAVLILLSAWLDPPSAGGYRRSVPQA